MTNELKTQVQASSTDTDSTPVKARVADVLEADEIKQIDSDPKQDDDLDEELDDVDAEDEEDEELEEAERVETVAKANRGL